MRLCDLAGNRQNRFRLFPPADLHSSPQAAPGTGPGSGAQATPRDVKGATTCFMIADIMFAPVVTRFRTYGVELGPVCQAYADAVLDQPLMREWTAAALKEPPPGEVPY